MTSTSNPGVPSGAPPVLPEIMAALGKLRQPVFVTHVVPDADALGSTFALARAWRDAEHHPRVVLPEGSLSQRLGFLLEWAEVELAQPETFAEADGFVVLDTAKESRCNVGPELKKTDWSAGRPVINIDHHGTNTRFGTVNWVVASAGSTSELIYYLLATTGHPIDARTASLLYAGIHSDTVGFSLPTTSAAALSAAADLVKRGADVAAVGQRLCRSNTRSEFELLRAIYRNTKVVADGQIAYSTASCDEIRGAGCTAADIDDQVNVVRSLQGVRLALLLTEGNPGKTRINFRGEGNVTVVELAQVFKGGGHSQSAGAVLACPPEEALEQVLPRALEHLSRFDGQT